MTKNLELRMYHLVLYQLTGIQMGIQSLHSCVEYQLMYGDSDEYLDWANDWKTTIILNGGTSNSGGMNGKGVKFDTGSMEQHYQTLVDMGVNVAKFHEPDLNDSLSAIAFICDERVFDKANYPDLNLDGIEDLGEINRLSTEHLKQLGSIENMRLRKFLNTGFYGKPFKLA